MLSYPVRIALIAALGGFLFGFETAVISGAEKTIQQLWSLSSFWQGFTVASSLIGTVLGSIIAGYPARRYGRKKVLIAIAVFYLIFYRLRFCFCLVFIYPFPVCWWSCRWCILSGWTMYISEISPANLRGRLAGSFS
ncbi:MAG: MFS transporter [Ferruginibacter sp.]